MADPLPPNPFPFLTPSYAGGRNSICRSDTPYPSVSQESVPSQIDNLTNALYGSITKTVQNNRVIWNIPCDPTTAPATILGVSRNTNEGLLCYIIRALGVTIPTGFVTLDGIQTLTNKTLTAPVINTATINNLTATGILDLPTGSITSAMIAKQKQICKAWVSFIISGSTASIQQSFGVNSVTRNGSGDYTVNFITPSPFSVTNYCAIASFGGGVGALFATNIPNTNGISTTAFRFQSGSVGNSPTLQDAPYVSIAFFGN